MSKKMSKTYCPLAWNHSFINQDGSFQVCCTSEEFDNNIRNENGEKIFISDDVSPEVVMNSEFMKNIRKQMLDGEWPELCKRCEITEKHGGASRRVIEMMNYENQEQNQINLELTSDDGTTSAPITSADYRLGNLCNLQCRTCNPRSAQMWIREWNNIKPEEEQFSKEVMESYKNYNWIDSEVLVKDFKFKAPTLNHIHFAGGEPLIVPQMRKVLEICIESGNAKNIVLTYNTNMTVLPDNIINLWKEFKHVKILASVDAVGELNSYIRYPSKWDKIHTNLQKIDEYHKEFNVSECLLSTTVQALNIMKLRDIVEYLKQFNFIVPVPNLINLHVPYYFSSPILPKSLKKLVTLDLLSLKDESEERLPEHYRFLSENIGQIVNFMNSTDLYSEGAFSKFLEMQKKYDQNKNMDLYQFYPQFKDLAVKCTN
tara:strand:- start:4248 stop:5534 length:1287 start_codon:yes stop_codon:yes gene_type:complete